MRAASMALLSAAALLVSCGSGPDESARLAGADGSPGDRSPGAEVTELTEPSAEATGAETPGAEGAADVAVQLPGLPIGGGAGTFEPGDSQCIDVDLSGPPLPPGVAITIQGFGLSGGFQVVAGACGERVPCLGGQPLPGGCSVLVRWVGDAVEEQADLAVTAATLACPSRASCDAAVAATETAGRRVITLSGQDPERLREQLLQPDGEDGADPDGTDPDGTDPGGADPGGADPGGGGGTDEDGTDEGGPDVGSEGGEGDDASEPDPTD